MKRLLIISFFAAFSLSANAQISEKIDTIKIAPADTVLDNCPDDILSENVQKSPSFGSKMTKLFGWGKEAEEEINKLNSQVKSQRVLIDSMEIVIRNPIIVVKTVPTLNPEATKSIKRDEKFVSDLPKSYANMTKSDITSLTKQIDDKIGELLKQRDSLLASGSSKELIDAKMGIIQSLQREKQVINLSEKSNVLKNENGELTDQNDVLKERESQLKKYLYITIGILFVLSLIIAVFLQRKTIKFQDSEIESQLKDIGKKNTYLEHAARIIRHDMHSGINTYIPRGIGSLEKRLSDEEVKKLKIDSAIKMIKEGLNYTQKVYKSVYEFTNLVKQHVVLNKASVDLKDLLEKYFGNTSYSSQVKIEDLLSANVNETLFCNAIDNLVKNGLKYNDSEKKEVRIYMEEGCLAIQDNGRGLTQKEFDKICNAYTKKKNSDLDEEAAGLGLNICVAILSEHGFSITCEKNDVGTKMKIKLT